MRAVPDSVRRLRDDVSFVFRTIHVVMVAFGLSFRLGELAERQTRDSAEDPGIPAATEFAEVLAVDKLKAVMRAKLWRNAPC